MTTAAGLYVHVPFCLMRCGYCDFNAHAGLDHLKSPYLVALRKEAETVAPAWSGVPFVSLFLGGGTPTTLPPDAIGRLLAHLRSRFDIVPDSEVTCEANPDTVDQASLAALRAAGVSRLSLGVQSFDPTVLAALERVHPPESARAAFAAARAAGFGSVNVDLIFGANAETADSWRRTLEEAVALEPEHLSCYALTIEPATPLGRKVAAGLVPAPDPDVQADRYEEACRVLGAAGYRHYEVSNWARPGHESVHNLGYWEGRPYLGLGAGAHSHRDGRRWWNVRPPQRYIELATEAGTSVAGEEVLGAEDVRLERLMLGLRAADGVPIAWVGQSAAADQVRRGLAVAEDDRLRLTERGMFLANDVVLALTS
ncbi:MAG TPA: radical SAM family heme chaperone HemW [Actinomycetota bacterium]|nr:radical SAM family heme chaperone HemW [Actinomycetota bacterium]